MKLDLEKIQKLSLTEPKTLEQRFIKLIEESGELAQELLIKNNASGFAHKQESPDGVLGECADILLVVLSIYFKSGGSMQDLSSIITSKSAKWERWQRK